MGIFSRISGLDGLAERFRPNGHPEGDEYLEQTVKIGIVRYRRCVTVILNEAGLYLDIKAPLRRSRELFIPWDAINNVSPENLYGRKGMRLSFGVKNEDGLIVYADLFESMRPHLRPGKCE